MLACSLFFWCKTLVLNGSSCDISHLQSEATALGHQVDIYKARLEAFGFNAIVVDGHNVEELIAAFKTAEQTKDKPTGIVAKTLKGKLLASVVFMCSDLSQLLCCSEIFCLSPCAIFA